METLDAPRLVITPEELTSLTDRNRPTTQARILTAMGIPLKVHPVDGTTKESRAAVEHALGGPGDQAPANQEFDVNVARLSKHWKTANTR
jgi:hypothetical protein